MGSRAKRSSRRRNEDSFKWGFLTRPSRPSVSHPDCAAETEQAYYLSPPNLRPICGLSPVPDTLIGISAPAPFLWKNGSTGLSRTLFHFEATIWESSAPVRTLPVNSNCLPSRV